MKKVLTLFLIFYTHLSFAQLIIGGLGADSRLAKIISGSDFEIRNVKFRGAITSRGAFTNKQTSLPFKDGIILSTGDIMKAAGFNRANGMSTANQTSGDKNLSNLVKKTTYDAAILEFDFIPCSDVISFRYIFASEEYNEYVNSGFNDIFGFLLTNQQTGKKTNMAVLPGTNTPITINNINSERNSSFFYFNNREQEKKNFKHGIEYDGFTKPLIAYAEVEAFTPYHIKICIADVGDMNYDSSVFIEGSSFTCKKKNNFIRDTKTYFSKFDPDIKDKVQAKFINDPTVKEVNKHITSKKFKPLLVHFDFDSDIPSFSEKEKIQQRIKILKNSKRKIIISGHTDVKGNNKYNVGLSKRRAESIKRFLIKEGVPEKRIITKFYSFKQTISKDEDAKNRRVVIDLLP